jgi:hypothetical protein
LQYSPMVPRMRETFSGSRPDTISPRTRSKGRRPSGERDAIVVGAGPNGLAAATVLALHGLDVLVVEARGAPGGAVRSAELTLPGFVHDVCSAVHPMAVASPFLRRLPLQDHGLQWIQPPVPLAHPRREPAQLSVRMERPGSHSSGYSDRSGTASRPTCWAPSSVGRDTPSRWPDSGSSDSVLRRDCSGAGSSRRRPERYWVDARLTRSSRSNVEPVPAWGWYWRQSGTP